ncbi:MAG: type IV pilus modification protein PilV [Gammaproteobacteria bacterium]|nr:type IV pilus modification protein PilV [Gammaproteobacteria bacterium]
MNNSTVTVLKHSPKQQSGMGMIESLIALVVISVGLLGIAALQITSMQQTASSHWHSQAVWYSYEISDRISANGAANFNLYDGIDTDNDYSMDCQGGPCTAAQMVTADAQDWGEMIDTLPGGRGVITATGTNLQISVMWEDNSAESNCTNGEPATASQSCYTVTITP